MSDQNIPVATAQSVPVNNATYDPESQQAKGTNYVPFQQDSNQNQGAQKQGFLAGILTCLCCFPLLWMPKYCFNNSILRTCFDRSLGKWFRPWTWGQDPDPPDVSYNPNPSYAPPHPHPPPPHHRPGTPPSPHHRPHTPPPHHHHGRGRGRGHGSPGRGRGRGSPGRGH